jgi:hypothetical protein
MCRVMGALVTVSAMVGRNMFGENTRALAEHVRRPVSQGPHQIGLRHPLS